MEIIAEAEVNGQARQGIDDEHSRQSGLLDQLVAALASTRDLGETTEVLRHFVAFTEAHFRSEGLLMRLYDYPQHDAHVDDHDAMMAETDRLSALAAAGDADGLANALQVFRIRLATHIASKDGALDRYLAERGD